MKKFNLITVLFLLFLMQKLIAQEKNNTINFSGKIEADHISYFKNLDNKINGRNQTLFLLNIEPKEKTKFNYFSSIEFREDFSDKNRNRVYLQQTYASYKNKVFNIEVGKQIIEWGKADKIKPTNNICPIDYTDFLDNERIGVFSVNSFFYYKNTTLQVVFIPIFGESILPNQNSRWHFNHPEVSSSYLGFSKYSALSLEADLPPNDIRSNQIAIQLSQSFSGFDVDVNYYNGYTHIYESIVSATPVAPDSIHFVYKPNYYKQQVIGSSISKVVKKYSLRAEAAYFLPDGKNNNIKYFRYSLGVDRTFYDLFGYNNLMILLQWSDEMMENNMTSSDYDINHLFKSTMLLRIDYSIGMYAKIIMQGIYRFDANDYYIQPSFKYNIGNGFNMHCSIDILGGKKDSFFLYFNQNDRVQLKFEYVF